MLTKEQKQHLELWADALESGEYTQARCALNAGDNKMCCLGVACDVFRKQTGRGEWGEAGSAGRFHFHIGGKDSAAIIPHPEIFEYFGLQDSPELPVYDNKFLSQRGFYYANDYEECTFEDIAQTIRGIIYLHR